MKIRILSDLHNEFKIYDVPFMEDEHEQVLVLAGDIGLLTRSMAQSTIFDFIDGLTDRFYKVIMVAGNHEYYGSRIDKVESIMYNGKFSDDYGRTGWASNFHYLQDDFVMIGDVVFVGATLWTNFDNLDAMTMMDAKLFMNDYRRITINSNASYHKLTPNDVVNINIRSKSYIFNRVDEYRNTDKKVVVISHHLPSYKSISPEFSGSSLNGAYASVYDEEIALREPYLWIHGHTHGSLDYDIGKTRIICNPRGYAHVDNNGCTQENNKFDPFKIVEV